MSEWRDIESAPRDGTKFLAYWRTEGFKDHRFIQVMKWDKCRMKFIISWDHDDEVEPTHWQPLPPAPN